MVKYCANCGRELPDEAMYCPDCGNLIGNNSNYCKHCSPKHRLNSVKVSDENKPSKEDLLELIKTKPFTEIGKMYGVTDNAIRKWCKKY